MHKSRFLVVSMLAACAICSCSSDSDEISDDYGEVTILTGKRAKGEDHSFKINIDGQYKEKGGFNFEEYDPLSDDELDEMKDLNGDGQINCDVKHLSDKYTEIKKHIKEITHYSDYELPGDVKASNTFYAFSFGKSKGTLVKKHCDLSFKEGERLKLEKYDVQFYEKDVNEVFDGNELSITSSKIRLKAKDLKTENNLRQYKSGAYFNDHIYDLRSVKKNWIEEKTEFTYRIDMDAIIIEGEHYTFSGTVNQERRTIRMKQTYPAGGSGYIWFDIEF